MAGTKLRRRGSIRTGGRGWCKLLMTTACESIASRFNAEAAEAGFAGMLIDHEHFKHDEDKETVAYGWLSALATSRGWHLRANPLDGYGEEKRRWGGL